MAQIYARWGAMNGRSASLDFVGQKLDYYNLMLSIIAKDLPFSDNIKFQIKKAFCEQYFAINRNAIRIKRMSTTLGNVANQYRCTEEFMESDLFDSNKVIADFSVNGIRILGKGEGTSSLYDGTVHSIDWVDKEDILEGIGEFGIVGNIISVIGSHITGGDPAKNTIISLKYLAGTVDDIAEAAGDTTSNWKNYFGFNLKDTKGFWDSMQEQIDDLKFGKSKTVSSNVSVAAKWAGYIATGLFEGYENIWVNEEGNSTGRQIAETVGETAVTIGMGALATAGVTAGLAAAGVVAAPAVAIGLASVGVCWAVNSVCEHLTGKDFAEYVSDKIIDRGIEKINEIKETGVAIGKATKTVADKIGGWWQKAFG